MKANESRVEDFLSTTKTQFIIPVYQRNYDWSITQCKQLLDDILEIGQNNEVKAHFIGSIVYIHDDIYTSSRIKELTIIDGQQRLTTLTLVYLTVYLLAKAINDEGLKNEIYETYLINKFASEGNKLKLRPTDNNRKAIEHILENNLLEDFNSFSKIIENFTYFQKKITKENLNIILNGMSKLMFVEISLDRTNDNPQRIFESLNSTGLELSQADLIRNYILMGLHYHEQNKIYNEYWSYIENKARDEISNESKVSDFIRDYLTLTNHKIPNKKNVYLEFKTKYPTLTLEKLQNVLSQLKLYVRHYNKLVNPKNETDKDIQLQLQYINRLEVNVAFPFLMKVYEDFTNDVIDKTTFISVLEFIQSFVWRRFIVGLPTNSLNKIFMTLYEKINHDNYLESLQKHLLTRTGSQKFPTDNELLKSLKLKDVYSAKTRKRTYFLERLENFNNNELVKIEDNADITIEHIFPQNPEAKWKNVLGDKEYNVIKENYLNTIANLTLSGNNGKLGNKYFTHKRDLKNAGYKDSRLWLNRYLASLDKWDIEELENRFNILAKRFLEIWYYPNIELGELELSDEVSIFDAEEPTHKRLESIIFFNQKLEFSKVSSLYAEVFRQLFDLNSEIFYTTDLAEKIGLSKISEKSNLRQAIEINENYFIEGNLDNVSKFNRIKHALTLFNAEDELLIKYAK